MLEMRGSFGPELRIHDMLGRFGVHRASANVQCFMSALSQGAARMSNIQCVRCTRIDTDMRILLDVLGLA